MRWLVVARVIALLACWPLWLAAIGFAWLLFGWPIYAGLRCVVDANYRREFFAAWNDAPP